MPSQNITNLHEQSTRYTHVNTSGATSCTAAQVLIGVVVNTVGASANSLTLYDSLTTGSNTIAVIDCTAAVGTIPYFALLKNGLTAVLAVGTVADLTILYK